MNPKSVPAGEPQNPLLLTASQLAKTLNLSERTLWRLRSAGKLPKPVRIAGSVRWRFDEITIWIESGCPTLDGQKTKKELV